MLAGIDVIHDFTVGVDKIDLHQINNGSAEYLITQIDLNNDNVSDGSLIRIDTDGPSANTAGSEYWIWLLSLANISLSSDVIWSF